MKTHTIETAAIEMAVRHRITTAAISLAFLLAGCGGGGGSTPAAVNSVTSSPPAVQTETAANSFKVTSDNYGMENATYLASGKSSLGIVLRAAIASGVTDQNFKTVFRIDISDPGAVNPAGVYSLGAATATAPAFPGNIYFFNGHTSTLLKTVGGTITFKAYGSYSGDRISGSFSAVVEDGNDPSTPKPSYTIAADFDFFTDSNGPVLPAATSVALSAVTSYDANCASCHALGSHDPTATGAADLTLMGGRMNGIFTPGLPSHQGIRLASSDITALKVLLNAI